MTANFASDDDPIARRLRGQFAPPTPGDLVKAAAWELEREFAEAVRHASTGVEFDPRELVELGLRCGRTPYQTFVAIRIAETAYAQWLNCVPLNFT
jgi:hypothetical protein